MADEGISLVTILGRIITALRPLITPKKQKPCANHGTWRLFCGMLAAMKPIRALVCLLFMLPSLALAADPVAPATKGANGAPPSPPALANNPASSVTNSITNGAPNGTKPSVSTQELKARFNALQQYFTEDEWKQVSRYLLHSALDGLQGTEDATLAPDLTFRLEILKRRMMVEGNTLMNEISNQWQQLMTPPPPVPYEPRPLPIWNAPVYTPPPASAR